MRMLQRFLATVGLCLITAAAHADCTIYVSHNSDGDGPFWQFINGSNNEMWLREAIEVGRGDARCYTDFEKDRIVGGNFIHDAVFCGTVNNTRNWILNPANPGCGPNNADTIRFWDDINGGITINLGKRVLVDPRDSIDGAPMNAGERSNIFLLGPGPGGSDDDMGAIEFEYLAVPAGGAVRNLFIDNFRFFGILASEVNGLSIKGVTISRITPSDSGHAFGLALGSTTFEHTGVCVVGAQVGGAGAGEENYFYDIAHTAVSLWDGCTGIGDRNNKVFNNYIGICETLDTGLPGACVDNYPSEGIGQRGIAIIDTPDTRIGGSGVGERNFIARSAGAGIYITGSGSRNTRVFNNWIGLAPTGFAGRGNGSGIALADGATQNQIGGSTAEGNVIASGTQHGVHVNGGDANRISGNVLGLNAARTLARGNAVDGIAINTGNGIVVENNVIAHSGGWGVYANAGSGHAISSNVIGLRGSSNNSNDNSAAPNAIGGVWLNNIAGNSIGTGNRIAANTGPGIRISGEGADNNSVRGNVIGLSSGNDLRPNSIGIQIDGSADGNTVGGVMAADRNTISGNSAEGLRITGSGSEANIVRGNYIGTTPNGLGAAPNTTRGLRVDSGASGTLIIGNLISGNTGDGVALAGAGAQTKVQGNSIGLGLSGNAMPNSAAGVAVLNGTSGALIGDTAAPNTIAANGGFGVFIAHSGSDGNTISGNMIGSTDAMLANAGGGITIQSGASGNSVVQNTVIGHASDPGIEIAAASSNSVRGNHVGITAAGLIAPNQVGVRLINGASGNTIGGSGADRNIISGNTQHGVRIANSGTASNSILGNRIGTDALGTSARPNFIGLLIESGATSNNVIENLISGNSGDGVRVEGLGSDGNRIQRNRVGLTPTGNAILANGGDGILIGDNAGNNFIGGLPAQANMVKGNSGTGVRIESGNGNDVSFNSIFGNGRLGIDIGPFNLSPNDSLDSDSGGNDVLNFPTLSNVIQNGANVSMTVTQNGLPSKQHAVLVYANSACDGSGSGEGETYLDTVSVATNAAGSAMVDVMMPLPSSAPVVAFAATANAATAAGSGDNTSEFSPCASTAPLPNAIYADGFETVNAMRATAKLDIGLEAVSRIARVSGHSATLTLVFDNRSAHTQPARSMEIYSDRAVIVESVDADNAACDLLGVIVCELPALAPGRQAHIVVQLGHARDALTMSLRQRSGVGTQHRQDFLLLPE